VVGGRQRGPKKEGGLPKGGADLEEAEPARLDGPGTILGQVERVLHLAAEKRQE
jgi:hypothetical protein